MKTNKLWSILMMLVFALGACISFSSCSSDDDDASGGSTSGGGASATSMPGSYTGITSESTKTLNAVFAEDGTGVINRNGKQYTFTYSMGGKPGIITVKGGYTYTINFIDGFMLFEESDGDIAFILYKSDQNLGSPNAKKLVGSWGNKIVSDYRTKEFNYTFNSDGTGTATETEIYSDEPNKYEYKYTITYKMENAYVAKCTEKEEGKVGEDYYAAIVLNNKLYILYDRVDHDLILSKK